MAGFCHGVKRALDLVIKTKKDNPDKNVYILGELIHNNQVIDYLNSIGINTIDEIPESLEGICVIRTHGTTPSKIKQLVDSGVEIVDATCPDVKKVQQKAKELNKNGYKVILIGKSQHPEVVAIKAHADDENKDSPCSVVNSQEEVEALNLAQYEKVGVVVQTTQTKEKFENILAKINSLAKEVEVFNTICLSTTRRQKEALELAKEVDLMIVVGGKTSANTTHLAKISKDIVNTIHIETQDELAEFSDVIQKAQTVGVTAGASTPQDIIQKIIERIGEN